MNKGGWFISETTAGQHTMHFFFSVTSHDLAVDKGMQYDKGRLVCLGRTSHHGLEIRSLLLWVSIFRCLSLAQRGTGKVTIISQ